MLSLTQRSFRFGDFRLIVACRQSPDELSRCTLTLQNDEYRSQQQGGADRGDNGDDVPDLIGLDLWPASIALCQYLVANPCVVSGQAILELGAGMGLSGILAAKLGAKSVLLTDYEPLVLEQLGRNLEANAAPQCSVQSLDWLRLAALPVEQRGSWRLLLAADVLYASVIVQPFVDTLHVLLHPTEGVALVAHQIRRAIMLDRQTRLPRLEEHDEPFEAFLAACHQAGMHTHVLCRRATCSNVDTDPMMLVGVAQLQQALDRLPDWDHGSGGGVGDAGM